MDAVPLSAVLITPLLAQRPHRVPDAAAENRALRDIVSKLGGPPLLALQALADEAIRLCGLDGTGTAGVSLLESDGNGGQQFRWTVLSGTLAAAVGGTTPRDDSPCGVCLDAEAPVLFSHPERRFTYFQRTGKPFVEGLVVPFAIGTAWEGTIWVLAHEEHQFDQEDVRLMTVLADLTATVYAQGRALELQQLQARFNNLEQDTINLLVESDRTRRLYETVLGGTPDFAYIWDLRYKFIYANPALLKLYGLPAEKCIGYGFRDVGYPEWHAAMHEREIDEVVRTAQPLRGKIPFYAQGGGGIYDYIFVPVLGPDGKVEAVGGITRDVTELDRITQALQEADKRKDEFLATLAHELRNPLAPLTMGLRLIKDAPSDASAQHTLDSMERQLQHMVHLVDDLLDLSRVSRGAIELRVGEHDLVSILQQALDTSRPQIEEYRHRVVWHVPEQLIPVDGDATRLVQVFSNLLNNAAKYTLPGGRITLAASVLEGTISVSVTDTGIGIAAKDLHRVFEMFTQVENSVDPVKGGLGIGLHVVKRLVEMHRGGITVHSTGEGQGSTFTVTLPLGNTAPTPTTGRDAAPAFRAKRILIVDDNVDAAFLLSMLLKKRGHDVHATFGAHEALDLAGSFRPEVIFLDIGMPQLDGYEACRLLRQMGSVKAAYIVALTGWGQEEDKRKARDAGFDDHLVKPAGPEQIERLLANIPERTAAHTSA